MCERLCFILSLVHVMQMHANSLEKHLLHGGGSGPKTGDAKFLTLWFHHMEQFCKLGWFFFWQKVGQLCPNLTLQPGCIYLPSYSRCDCWHITLWPFHHHQMVACAWSTTEQYCTVQCDAAWYHSVYVTNHNATQTQNNTAQYHTIYVINHNAMQTE